LPVIVKVTESPLGNAVFEIALVSYFPLNTHLTVGAVFSSLSVNLIYFLSLLRKDREKKKAPGKNQE
jgi:hypothetical protein